MATMWEDWVKRNSATGRNAMPNMAAPAPMGAGLPSFAMGMAPMPEQPAMQMQTPAAPPMMFGAPAPQMFRPAAMPSSGPMPPPRPADVGAPMQLGSAAPSVRESFMQRLLSGPNYQSNSMPVMPQGATTPQQINFGNPDNPADFVRADRALMGLPEDALRIAGLLG